MHGACHFFNFALLVSSSWIRAESVYKEKVEQECVSVRVLPLIGHTTMDYEREGNWLMYCGAERGVCRLETQDASRTALSKSKATEKGTEVNLSG